MTNEHAPDAELQVPVLDTMRAQAKEAHERIVSDLIRLRDQRDHLNARIAVLVEDEKELRSVVTSFDRRAKAQAKKAAKAKDAS